LEKYIDDDAAYEMVKSAYSCVFVD